MRQFGRFGDGFSVGDVYPHFPPKTITESDNNIFCLLTMNHHPLHLDATFAEGTVFAQRVVVGTLVLSLAVGMSVPDVSGAAVANLSYNDVLHHKPVFIGDTIRASSEVLALAPTTAGTSTVVTVMTSVWNQRDDLVLTFKRSVLVPSRAPDSDD